MCKARPMSACARANAGLPRRPFFVTTLAAGGDRRPIRFSRRPAERIGDRSGFSDARRSGSVADPVFPTSGGADR